METTTETKTVKCKCGKDSGWYVRPITQHSWARFDHRGFFTGIYCDECYNSGDTKRYPYRKDDYTADAIANGERIEEDY